MLEKFVDIVDYFDIVDYSKGFSDNSSKVPLQPPVEKPSYVEMVKSKNFNKTVPRPRKKEPNKTSNYQGKLHGSDRHPFPIQKQWLIKNHEVAKINFENLWIISKLFAFDD